MLSAELSVVISFAFIIKAGLLIFFLLGEKNIISVNRFIRGISRQVVKRQMTKGSPESQG